MNEMPETLYRARVKSFTRRNRNLPPNLRRLMENDGGKYVIEPRRGEGHTTLSSDFFLDIDEHFGRHAPLVLEIGPGVGDQLVAAAQRDPDRNFLALEVYKPGIAKLVSKAVAASVTNIRILEADAAQALPIVIPDASVSEVWTFFPDPWRKKRHFKRRLINAAFAKEIARILTDNGMWRLATDWDSYAWSMRDAIESCDELVNSYAGENPDPHDPDGDRGGFAPRWEGRITTRFEQTGIDAGRHVHDLMARRVSRHGKEKHRK